MANYLTETGLTKLVTKIKGMFYAHTSNTSNPHKVTKTQLGLDNTENKSSQMIRSELTTEDVVNALSFTPQPNVANSAGTDGYVTKGEEFPNMVWKTDENGNPAWRTDSTVEVDSALSNCDTNDIWEIGDIVWICNDKVFGVYDKSSNKIINIENCPLTYIDYIALVEDNKYIVVGQQGSVRKCVYYWTDVK